MSRFNYERGACWDDKNAQDLTFEQTVAELEKHRECIKRINNALDTCYGDELPEFIDAECNKIL